MSSVLIGQRVRSARARAGWSVRDFAGRLGVSVGTVSAIENGKTGVSVERLARMSEVLGTTPAELLGDSDPVTAARAQKEPELAAAAVAANTDLDARDWRRFDPLHVDQVLQAAIDAFVEIGYHGATMRSIADKAGMSVPGVYHHYASKQDLLVRILDITMDDLEWRIQASCRSLAAPTRRLAAIVEALALFHAVRADVAFIGASEMRSLEQPNRRRIADRRTAVQHAIDLEISSAVASGEATVAQPAEAGRAIATMCTSLPQWFDPAGPADARQVARDYAQIALRVIGAAI